MTRSRTQVTIKVVCCSPEKIKQKINCKGGDSIKSIEILPPPKPKEPAFPEESEKPKEPKKPKEPPKPKEKPPAAKTRQASKVTFVDHRLIRTQRVAGNATRSVRRGGPSICYDGYYGRPVYDSWGGSGGGGCYRVNRCDYFCEENPNAACRIM
ncbi:hypothetical protein Pint_09445 [Pistacia integerrima]|uniref:Uncharacterized protein n=1 Tax=Pistacia integerrima TaxID=434235 RepID=A0ACC0XNC5_9ROSI|nr:hypothetical protein Pint_09445 [Pistacia integerrima]